jgi:hypothetical protein
LHSADVSKKDSGFQVIRTNNFAVAAPYALIGMLVGQFPSLQKPD